MVGCFFFWPSQGPILSYPLSEGMIGGGQSYQKELDLKTAPIVRISEQVSSNGIEDEQRLVTEVAMLRLWCIWCNEEQKEEWREVFFFVS